MDRKELVAKAKEAGIKNAHTLKSEALIQMLTPKSTGQKGRPVVPGSARQLRLEAQAARVALNGGIVKRGRPIVGESKRQQKLLMKNSGVIVKRGRPKKVQSEVAEA